jgi:hypothetical protein
MGNLEKVSSALTWGLSREAGLLLSRPVDAAGCGRFVAAQLGNLPGWLKPPFVVLALGLQLTALALGRGLFTRLEPEVRAKVARAFEALPGPTREFVRFHRLLVGFYAFEALGRKERP